MLLIALKRSLYHCISPAGLFVGYFVLLYFRLTTEFSAINVFRGSDVSGLCLYRLKRVSLFRDNSHEGTYLQLYWEENRS